jgi:predicted transposase YdaD
MRGATVPTPEQAATLAREQAAGPDAGDLVSLLAVFMARFHGDTAARELVRRIFMSTELLDESPLYQAWQREWREVGWNEGREQGREAALREAARTTLAGRFGALDESLMTAINAAPETALLDLLAHVATESLDQLRGRLGGA